MSGMDETEEADFLSRAIQVANESSIPPQPARLGNGVKSIIADVDFFEEQYGVVWFVRSTDAGHNADHYVYLEKDFGEWRASERGGRTPGSELDRRPTTEEINQMNAWNPRKPISFALSAGGTSGFGEKPASLHMQVAKEVAELKFSNRPPKHVAAHGLVTLLFRPTDRPRISAFDKDGNCIGEHTPIPITRPTQSTADRIESRLSRSRSSTYS